MTKENNKRLMPVETEQIRENLLERYLELLKQVDEFDQRAPGERLVPRRVFKPDAHIRIQMGAADEALTHLDLGKSDAENRPE